MWQQSVIALYGSTALFAFVNLFGLQSSRRVLGVILAVLAIGIWLVARKLRYSRLDEAGLIAQHKVDQTNVSLKSVSIRRATENLKVVPDYARLCCILESAFFSTGFDAFELDAELLPQDYKGSPSSMLLTPAPKVQFKWVKPPYTGLHDGLSTWSLTLELITTQNARRGSMKIFRRYNHGPLHEDLNFLTSVFPVVLADALDRVLSSSDVPSDGLSVKRFSPSRLSTFYERCTRKRLK